MVFRIRDSFLNAQTVEEESPDCVVEVVDAQMEALAAMIGGGETLTPTRRDAIERTLSLIHI